MRTLTVTLAVALAAALTAIGALATLYVTDEGSLKSTTVTTTVAAEPAQGPPSGLDDYGLLLWNLEALLRDTFGVSSFYSNPGDEGEPFDFNTEFRGNCCSGTWDFTFADARNSDLRLLDPEFPPEGVVGGSGASLPLTINGQFISCGRDEWLFHHVGGAGSRFSLNCGAE
jgi:hypothetical protein